MIAAISLMRQRDYVTLAAFRRHWLDVHGPLVCAFPALRRYVQHHVVASPIMNAQACDMRIAGFPILWFDNDADRVLAHHSPEMAACNVDVNGGEPPPSAPSFMRCRTTCQWCCSDSHRDNHTTAAA